jgi:hypothetical protein
MVYLVYNKFGDNMERRDRIINLYFKSIKQFNEIESQPRDFGTGDLLYSSEIHTLEAVGKYPDSNLIRSSEYYQRRCCQILKKTPSKRAGG